MDLPGVYTRAAGEIPSHPIEIPSHPIEIPSHPIEIPPVLQLAARAPFATPDVSIPLLKLYAELVYNKGQVRSRLFSHYDLGS